MGFIRMRQKANPLLRIEARKKAQASRTVNYYRNEIYRYTTPADLFKAKFTKTHPQTEFGSTPLVEFMYEKTTTVICDSSGSRISFSGGCSVQHWVRLAAAGAAGSCGHCSRKGVRARACGDCCPGLRTGSGGGRSADLRAADSCHATADGCETSGL